MRDALFVVVVSSFLLVAARRASSADDAGRVAPVTLHVLAVPRRRVASVRRAPGFALDREQVLALLQDARRDPAIEVLALRRVTAHLGESVRIALVRPISYIARYGVEEQGDEVIADPIVSTVEEGVTGEATLREDAGLLSFHGRLDITSVARPIRERTVRPVPHGAPMTIQEPQTSTEVMSFALEVSSNGWLLVGGAGGFAPGAAPTDDRGDEREVVLLVHVGEVGPAGSGGGEDVADAVEIETRFLDVPSDVAAHALGPVRAGGSAALAPLDRATRALLLEAPGARVLAAPRVTALAGRPAEVSVIAETAYVRDYEVHEGKDGVRVVSPVVATLQDGFRLVVSARPKAGGSVLVHAHATFAWLHRPIPEKEVEVAGRAVRVQCPELEIRGVEADGTVTDGAWVVLGGLGATEHGEALVLVRVRRVELSSAGGAPAPGRGVRPR